MIVKLKFVDRCPNNHRGEFIVRSAKVCEVQIAKNHLKCLNDLAEALLHELLHLWVTILQEHGVKQGIRKEHRFINSMVPKLINKLAKEYK